mmetsp:Transcript_91988/g.264673  ORF Transcript_91988/g.264673 Transcript_91988/m.264673 type:complete len:226 (+) Transcript_91988:40-717(+)
MTLATCRAHAFADKSDGLFEKNLRSAGFNSVMAPSARLEVLARRRKASVVLQCGRAARRTAAPRQQGLAQGRNLVVDSPAEEEIRQPQGRGSLHYDHADLEDGVLQICGEQLHHQVDDRVGQEVCRTREHETAQEWLQPKPAVPLQSLDADHEPHIEQNTNEQQCPANKTLVLVVPVRVLTLQDVVADEQQVEERDGGSDALRPVRQCSPGAVQCVALRDHDQQR